jgi:glycosyltransferase involved in cell wall biosynthesis
VTLKASPVLLSVVTPVLNGEKWIRKNIASVQSLSLPHEHIIVDGGSSDNTLDIVLSEPGDHRLILQHNSKGMYEAVHQGFSEAKGVYLMHLNSDDFLIADALDSEYKHFASVSSDMIIYGGYLVFEDSRDPRLLMPTAGCRYFMSRGIIPTLQPSIIFKRYSYFKHAYDFSYSVCADGELLSRMARDQSLACKARRKAIVNFTVRDDSFGNKNSSIAANEIASFSRATSKDLLLFRALRIAYQCIPWFG